MAISKCCHCKNCWRLAGNHIPILFKGGITQILSTEPSVAKMNEVRQVLRKSGKETLNPARNMISNFIITLFLFASQHATPCTHGGRQEMIHGEGASRAEERRQAQVHAFCHFSVSLTVFIIMAKLRCTDNIKFGVNMHACVSLCLQVDFSRRLLLRYCSVPIMFCFSLTLELQRAVSLCCTVYSTTFIWQLLLLCSLKALHTNTGVFNYSN